MYASFTRAAIVEGARNYAASLDELELRLP